MKQLKGGLDGLVKTCYVFLPSYYIFLFQDLLYELYIQPVNHNKEIHDLEHGRQVEIICVKAIIGNDISAGIYNRLPSRTEVLDDAVLAQITKHSKSKDIILVRAQLFPYSL